MHATTTPLNAADRDARSCASTAYHAQRRRSSVAAVGSSWSEPRGRGLRSGSKLRCESMWSRSLSDGPSVTCLRCISSSAESMPIVMTEMKSEMIMRPARISYRKTKSLIVIGCALGA